MRNDNRGLFGLVLVVLAIIGLCATLSHAQTTFRPSASLNVGLNSNLGYANPIVGANANTEIRGKRVGGYFSFNADRIRKNVGGSGFAVSGQEAMRYFVGNYFIEGGLTESHYAVKAFNKSAVNALVGVGYSNARLTLRGDYQYHLWETAHPTGTPNNARAVSFGAQFYLKHHLTVGTSIAVQRFQSHPASGVKQQTGVATSFSIGVWK